MTRLGLAVALAGAAVAASGCASIGARTVADVANLPGASGPPRIDAVYDLGDLERLPETGARVVTTGGDGLFAVGEALLIEGDDFGRQPTLLIGNRPATVIARTGSGGIVTRVPPRAPSGRVEVVVVHGRGRAAATVPVTRHALALQPNEGRVHVLTIEAGGHVDIANILPIPGAVDLVFSPDGQMAYVLQRAADAGGDAAPTANLVAIAMGSAGGPQVVNEIPLPVDDAHTLVASGDATVVFAVGPRSAVGIDVVVPRSPAAFEAFALRLAPASAVPTALALSPDGQRLAALLADDNRLAMFDVSDPSNPAAPVLVDVAPALRAAATVDLAFAPDGERVWIALGDRPRVAAGDRVDPSVVAVDVDRGDEGDELRVRPLAALRAAALAPLRLAVPLGEVGAGTAIRASSRESSMLLSTFAPGQLGVVAEPLSATNGAALAEAGGAGAVVRCNLEGEVTALFETDGPVTGLAVTPDGRNAVATTTRVIRAGGAYRLEYGVYVGSMDGAAVRYTRLGDVAPDAIMLAPAPVSVAP